MSGHLLLPTCVSLPHLCLTSPVIEECVRLCRSLCVMSVRFVTGQLRLPVFPPEHSALGDVMGRTSGPHTHIHTHTAEQSPLIGNPLTHPHT